MKNRFLSIALAITLSAIAMLGLAGEEKKQAAVQKKSGSMAFSTRMLARAAMQRPLAVAIGGTFWGSRGISKCSFDRNTGDVMAIAMKSAEASNECDVGFTSVELTNTSDTVWTDVKVEATFEVTAKAEGNFLGTRLVAVTGIGDSFRYHSTPLYNTITNPGTVTFTSSPFSVGPNTEVRILAAFSCDSKNSPVNGVWFRGRIKSFRFIL